MFQRYVCERDFSFWLPIEEPTTGIFLCPTNTHAQLISIFHCFIYMIPGCWASPGLLWGNLLSEQERDLAPKADVLIKILIFHLLVQGAHFLRAPDMCKKACKPYLFIHLLYMRPTTCYRHWKRYCNVGMKFWLLREKYVVWAPILTQVDEYVCGELNMSTLNGMYNTYSFERLLPLLM